MYSKVQILKIVIFVFMFAMMTPISSKAQTGPEDIDEATTNQAADLDVNSVESEMAKSLAKQKAATKADTGSIKEEKMETFSDLGKLSQFSEVSVIQKRYLPKTGRFQAFAGLTYSSNDPWFLGMGLSGKLGYFLTESWGVEFSYTTLSNSEKGSVQDLRSNQGVTTSSLISPKSYLGADVVWTPVYGKMSLGNKKIVPFDMYFSFGGGNTSTADSQNASTLRLATGQIFAITKGMGFRWDFCWNRYSAKSIDGAQTAFDNLLLTLGMSFFFPEAKYR